MFKYVPKALFSGIIVLTLLIGVFYMFNMYGYIPPLKYDVYTSKDPRINVMIDYISGWLLAEDVGAKGTYAQALFFLPRTKTVPYKALMAVTVIDKTKSGFQTIDGLAEDLLQKRNDFKKMRVVSRSKKEYIGKEAVDITLAYKKSDRLDGLDAKLIQVKERIIILENNGKFYVARYENKSRQFDKFNRAFSRMIKTLRFKK